MTQMILNEPQQPEAKMHLVPPTSPATARVVANDLCMKGKSASYVRHVVIDVSGTPLEGNFLSGQSFGVVPPGEDEFGKPHKVRLFSIACPTWGEDGEGRVLSTTPKRLIEEFRPQKAGDDPNDRSLFTGVCSNYLCSLRPGDEVKVTGPSGKRFVLPTNPADHDYVFLATGTGIAPFRGFVKELFEPRPGHEASWQGPCPSQVHLVMGAPYTTDLLYDELFRGLAAKHSNFHYHMAISRETRPNGKPGLYVHQLIEEQFGALRDLLASPRTLIYICGLAGMQIGLFRLLAAEGVGEGYLTVDPQVQGIDPRAWDEEAMKRRVRATRRCMVEVY